MPGARAPSCEHSRLRAYTPIAGGKVSNMLYLPVTSAVLAAVVTSICFTLLVSRQASKAAERAVHAQTAANQRDALAAVRQQCSNLNQLMIQHVHYFHDTP